MKYFIAGYLVGVALMAGCGLDPPDFYTRQGIPVYTAGHVRGNFNDGRIDGAVDIAMELGRAFNGPVEDHIEANLDDLAIVIEPPDYQCGEDASIDGCFVTRALTLNIGDGQCFMDMLPYDWAHLLACSYDWQCDPHDENRQLFGDRYSMQVIGMMRVWADVCGWTDLGPI
jgi:hypothetical protein